LQLAEQLSEDYWEKIHEEYRLPAGTAIAKLTAHAAKFGLVGFEVFTGVPATIAGAVVMNAGTGLGEVGQIVKEVSLVSKDGIFRTHKIKEGDFSYRQNHFIHPGEIITEVVLRPISINENIKKQIKDYLEMRNRTQPMKEKTCGCVFKNYSTDLRAGKLIDKLGLKGLNLFGFKISHTHANFVENHGDEGAEKFIEFISMIRDEIELFYGIKLEYEVLI
jgi:UDP-N-acetylmuramate dehydrogenase